jgi:hypothetical protein
MSDALELDQEDIGGRLSADPYFADITVLVQRKGVTENDIEAALSVINEKIGKIGAIAIIIMPELQPDSGQTPGARYFVRTTVQVIEQPLFNLGDTGTGKSAEQIAERIRQVLHFFSTGRGNVYTFDGMQPIAVEEGKISYGVAFRRVGGDSAIIKVADVEITATGAAAPATVTLACATAGAAIWYTTDGSFPSSANATATQYTVPFAQATAATIRAAAEKSGLQQSNVRQLTLT